MVNPITNTQNTPFKPMQSTGSNYAIVKPITTEQKKQVQEHKEKKGHKLGIAVATSVILTGGTILALMRGPKKLRSFSSKVFKSVEEKSAELKANNKTLNGAQKLYLKGLNNLKDSTNYANTLLNLAAFKDLIFKKYLSNKIPILKPICTKISDIFEKISIHSVIKAHSKTFAQFGRLYTKIDELTAELPKGKINKELAIKIQEKMTILKSGYDGNFGIGAVNARLRKMNSSLEGLDDKVWDATLHNPKKFIMNKDSFKKFVPEDLVAPQKQAAMNDLKTKSESIKNAMQDLKEIYKGVLDEKAYKKLEKTIDKTAKSLDKSIDKESNKLFDKLRDIKLGSAPTDFLGVVGAFGAAGWGLIKSDNNDERISASLQYGIPAIGAVSVSLLCATSLISAGPALAFGAVSGVAISKLGEFIDKQRKQYEQNAANKNAQNQIKTSQASV